MGDNSSKAYYFGEFPGQNNKYCFFLAVHGGGGINAPLSPLLYETLAPVMELENALPFYSEGTRPLSRAP
jgi:hypothetical protein